MSGINRNMHRAGFTLVELSIVLIIIGLLTGGILAGASLIRASELRSIITEYQNYQVAVRTFQQRFRGLPGDITNATDFWGVAAGDGAATTGACATAVTTNGKTCNGNGDGIIGLWYDTGEPFRFWQHLGNAGLIEGKFTGEFPGYDATYSYPLVVAGVNVPPSKLGGAMWGSIQQFSAVTALGYPEDMQLTNTFTFMQEGGSYNMFSPEEIWGIDNKIDDGKPATGLVMLFGLSSTDMTNCTTAVADSDFYASSYQMTQAGRLCGISFPKAF